MASLVDSSVWIAPSLDFDTQRKRAVRIFQTATGTLYALYCVVVAEVATVLTYKHSKEQANSFLTYIENNRDVVVFDDSASDEIVFYKSLPQRLSFTDAALLFLSKKLQAEVISFDAQLTRVAKTV